jgi:LPS export ABC transporter protein LptC
MPRSPSYTPLAFAVLAALVVLLGCERRERDVRSAVAADSAAAGPQQISWNARFMLQEDGQRRAHFRAAKMEHYETGDSTYAVLTTGADSTAPPNSTAETDSVESTRDSVDSDRPPTSALSANPMAGTPGAEATSRRRVYAYIFDENGDSSAVITADRMMYFDAEGRFEAFGDVVVETKDDKRLSSEHLTWDQTDRKIRTRRFVRIVTPTEDVQGRGLVADEDLDTYQLGRFTAQVEMEEDEKDGGPAKGEGPDQRGDPGDGPDTTAADRPAADPPAADPPAADTVDVED